MLSVGKRHYDSFDNRMVWYERMEQLTIEEKIRQIIASRLKDQSKIDALELHTPLLSLGIDSILALSILVEIEEAYDIEIDDSDLNMDKIKDIASFAALVRGYCGHDSQV